MGDALDTIARRWLVAALGAASLALTDAPARATDGVEPRALAPTTTSREDPLLMPGALLTATGVASTAAGALAWASTDRRCLDCRASYFPNEHRETAVWGGTLIGGGVGLLTIAGPTLLVAIGREPPVDPTVGEHARNVGLPLLASGTTALGAGIGQLVGGGGDRGPTLALSLASIGTGVVLIPIGATIWARGGRSRATAANTATARPGSQPASADEPPARSSAMKHAGMTLTGIGVAGTIAGAITGGMLAKERGDFAGLEALVVGGSIAGASAIFIAIGVPLWVIGAQRGGPKARTTTPTLRVGPGRFEASVAF